MSSEFVLSDGRTIRDIAELKQIILSMHIDTFRYHVNDERNDFATWIEDVFHEKQLAKRLKKAKTPEQFLKAFEPPKPKKPKPVVEASVAPVEQEEPIEQPVVEQPVIEKPAVEQKPAKKPRAKRKKKSKPEESKQEADKQPAKRKSKKTDCECCEVEVETVDQLKFAVVEFVIGLVVGFAAGFLLASL